MVNGMTISASETVRPSQLLPCRHRIRPANAEYTRKVNIAPLIMATAYACIVSPHDVQTAASAGVVAAKLQSAKTPGAPAQGTSSSE